jgi:spermidine synthase/MFS family permease
MNGLVARMLPYLLAFFSSFCIMTLELVAGRLVAGHVGASLTVWTSVIGIMLGGICLGNVLGGRLADRVEPSRAIGPLYALGAFLTIACLWVNAVVGWTPGLDSLPWTARTVLVVTLDFLVPGTVLGMIGPVVAKMAVEQSRKAGSAIGDVYFWGAIGSIVGTFLAGFVLMYLASVSAIVTMVAAALALLAAAMMDGRKSQILALLASLCLAVGSVVSVLGWMPAVVTLGSIAVNPVALAGHILAVVVASVAVGKLIVARRDAADVEEHDAVVYAVKDAKEGEAGASTSLRDLAALSFLASLGFMALEMVAGRLVTRHLGSSLYGWTSIIGVLLGGLSLGNYLGGKLADRIKGEKQASWLFLFASVLTLSILVMEEPQKILGDKFLRGGTTQVVNGETVDRPPPLLYRMITKPIVSKVIDETTLEELASKSVLSQAISMTKMYLPRGEEVPLTWRWRVLIVVLAVFFLPALSMGTVSPVVAKLAVDRLRQSKRTGTAIGQVYAWGMVGSILGTFLTGFFLIDVLGTKGVLLVLAALMAIAATVLGTIWHAAWAGIPLGLCVIAFTPDLCHSIVSPKANQGMGKLIAKTGNYLEQKAVEFGIREERGDPETEKDAKAWIDESNYYYIKVDNEPDAEGQKRTLVLDNLIHGYFILGHPERLDYDYEHIYGLVAHRVAAAKAKAEGKSNASQAPLSTLFLGGGAYTFQRYMQFKYPDTSVDVAEIDPAVTRANLAALGLPKNTKIRTEWGDARQFVERHQKNRKYDIVFGDAFNDFSVPWHLTTREFNDKLANMLTDEGVYMINIIDAFESDEKTKQKAERRIKKEEVVSDSAKATVLGEETARAQRFGGFLAAWVRTAKKTFGDNIYIFGTDDEAGGGLRETFVVVASKKPLDLSDLGSRDDDPKFFQSDKLFEPRPYDEKHCKEVDRRAKGIVLTDDYAPVENLLAPVAETRGDD